jgi:hypothetical protein
MRRVATGDDVRSAALELGEAEEDALSEFDGRFYEYPDPIEDRLFAYVVEHRHEITLS